MSVTKPKLINQRFLESLNQQKDTYCNSLAIPKVYIYLPELVHDFLIMKKAQGIAQRTTKDYIRFFEEFAEYLPSESVDYEELKYSVANYFSTKTDKAPATYNLPYAYLNCLFNWAVDDGKLPKNPIKDLKLKKRKDKGKARAIPEENIKKLLNSINISTYAGFRDYCFILLTLDTGIRPSEGFQLTTNLFDLENNKLVVTKEIAKTRMDRVIPITPQTSEILAKLIEARNEDWKGNLVFYTEGGNSLNIDMWGKRLKRIGDSAGVKIRPYDLRHTFAIMFLRNNGNMFALQELLGHTDLSMTKRYCKLAQSDLENQHSSATPVNAFLKRTTRVRKLFKNK